MGVFESIRNALGLKVYNEEFGDSNESDSAISNLEKPESYNQKIRIGYQGLLKEAGADAIYLHYSFENWKLPVQTVRMDRMPNGAFETFLTSAGYREINYCFKDSADHWDNNNGFNWVVSH